MDYKKMNAEELIRIISNKALNKTLKENDKLVIQDCCKELFEKKCHKYKKITYLKSKATYDEGDMGFICNTSVKKRIVEVIDRDNLPPHPLRFPEKICDAVLERVESEKYVNFKNFREEDRNFTILKVEDI